MKPSITIIVAVDRNLAIGYKNRLLFHLSADLKHFKQLTTGHTIVMGRHTFESLPKGALPNRRNIVLTTQCDKHYEGAEVYTSLDEALLHCNADEELFIIGGASVYRQTIGEADTLSVTEVQATAAEADVYFPAIDKKIWKEVSREKHPADEKNEADYDFVVYQRIGEEIKGENL
jgi:dihydrofolate reductase